MEETFKKVEEIFKNHLEYDEVPVIKIFDVKNGKILEGVSYDRVFFDVNFNIYKINKEGCFVPANSPDFKAVIVNKEKYKKVIS